MEQLLFKFFKNGLYVEIMRYDRVLSKMGLNYLDHVIIVSGGMYI